MSKAAEAKKLGAAAGRQAAEEVLAEGRGFRINKFGRHADGYYHARVTVAGGRTIYCHRKHGSWMAPGEENGRHVLKEIVNHEVKVALQEKAHAIEKAERLAAERAKGVNDGDTLAGADTEETDAGSAEGENAQELTATAN